MAATLGLGALMLARSRVPRNGWLLLGLVAAGSLLWAATAGKPMVIGELERAGVILANGSDLEAGTGRGWVEVWARALDAIQLLPLTGMGMNTFRSAVAALFPLWLAQVPRDVVHAHQELIQVALDPGLPGLAAFLALYIAAGRMLWEIAAGENRHADWPAHWRPYLALGLCGGLAVHLLFGMADTVVLGAKTGGVFWMILGLIVSLYHQTRPMAADRPARPG
jgi:O-antigen ligase